MGNIGAPEIILLLLVALLLFGAKRLPEIGRSLAANYKVFHHSERAAVLDEDLQRAAER